jgi:hypothetical protein
MPRVGYALPMQGFRPRTNPSGALGRYGLRGLGDSNTFSGCVSAVDGQGNPVSCSDPNAAVWFDANMNAVTPGTQAPPSAIVTGSVLNYGATVDSHWWTSQASVISGISGILASSGINLTQQATGTASGSGNFVLTLQLQISGAGFARDQDVKSIVDHAIYVQTGHLPLNSAIELVSTPSFATGAIPMSAQIGTGAGAGSGAPGSSQPTTFTAWLEQNAMWLGIGVLAVAVLPTLVRKL